MGCFCHRVVPSIQAQLSLLAAPHLAVTARIGARQMLAEELAALLAQWLAAHGLPAAPWQPEPAWLGAPLPQVRLSAQALATISAFAQLRAQVLAQFGLDLLLPPHAAAFARVVATMSARLSALAPSLAVTPKALIRLAALDHAVMQVTLALQAGLMMPPPPLMHALTAPSGILMNEWQALLAALRSLVPLIAASAQLGLAMNETFHAQLAAALRALQAIKLPTVPPAQLSAMASATAALSAVASLKASLGLDPLKVDIAVIRAQVTAKLAAMVQLLPPAMQSKLALPNAIALLMSMLPKLPVVPSHMATPEVMKVALAVHPTAVASMNWSVPPITAVPLLKVGLPAVALAAHLNAALGIRAVLPAPCGSGCDGAKLAAAAAKAAA